MSNEPSYRDGVAFYNWAKQAPLGDPVKNCVACCPVCQAITDPVKNCVACCPVCQAITDPVKNCVACCPVCQAITDLGAPYPIERYVCDGCFANLAFFGGMYVIDSLRNRIRHRVKYIFSSRYRFECSGWVKMVAERIWPGRVE